VKVETSLRQYADHSLYSFEVSARDGHQNGTGESALTIVLTEDDKRTDFSANLLSMTPTLDVIHGSIQSVGIDTLTASLAQEVKQIFQDEQASIAYLLRDSSMNTASKDFQLMPETTQAIEKRTTRAFKYASTYHITFSLFAASSSPSVWHIEEAIQQYIEPLLTRLSTVSDFHVDTQVQLFASFSPSIAAPQLDEATNIYKLLQSDLSGFINAA